jgi:hypothetical protein
MNLITIFFVIIIITTVIFLISRSKSTDMNSIINKNYNDNERIIIIRDVYKGNSTELIIDSKYLSIVFDNLINLIENFVKKIMIENNVKLTKEEIINYIPNYIASVVENILKITIMYIFEQQGITDLNMLKSKLLSITENNYINNFLIENNIKNTIDILNNSTQFLNSLQIYSTNDVINKIPKLLSDIVLNMAKNILNNILVFNQNGVIEKTTNLLTIKNEFINILNKYMPYKKVYYETNENGTNNLHGLTLKLEQLN